MDNGWRWLLFTLAILVWLATWVKPLRTWAPQLIATGAALALFPMWWDRL
jgi:hypothetical protein